MFLLHGYYCAFPYGNIAKGVSPSSLWGSHKCSGLGHDLLNGGMHNIVWNVEENMFEVMK
jgi:hypothetical protein